MATGVLTESPLPTSFPVAHPHAPPAHASKPGSSSRSPATRPGHLSRALTRPGTSLSPAGAPFASGSSRTTKLGDISNRPVLQRAPSSAGSAAGPAKGVASCRLLWRGALRTEQGHALNGEHQRPLSNFQLAKLIKVCVCRARDRRELVHGPVLGLALARPRTTPSAAAAGRLLSVRGPVLPLCLHKRSGPMPRDRDAARGRPARPRPGARQEAHERERERER